MVSPRGFVAELEAGHCDHLLLLLAERPQQLEHEKPELVLRMPSAYCQLFQSGGWTTIFMPHVAEEMQNKAWSVNWDLLHMKVPQVPRHLRPCIAAAEHLEHGEDITSTQLQQAADFLRAGFRRQLAEHGEDALPAEDLQVIYSLLATLQRQADLISPHHLRTFAQTRVGGSTGRATATYRYDVLIKSLLLADCLSADSDLARVISEALYYVLPRPLASTFIQRLRQAGVPSAATLSRARFQLDAAWMRTARGQTANCHKAGTNLGGWLG